MEFIDAVKCVEIAAGNANVALDEIDTRALAEAFVDMGADFSMETP